MEYLYHILIMIEIYLLMVYALNLIIGYSGLMILCAAIFYGIGAYGYALLSIDFGLSFFTAMFLAAMLSSIFAFLVGTIVLRFKDDYFVLITLALQMVFFNLLYNFVDVTNGPYGINAIPIPKFFIWEISTTLSYLTFFSILLLISVGLLFIIYNSPFAIALKALRDDKKSAQMLGKDSKTYFLKAFAIFGFFTAISGTWYASYIQYIDPTSFTLDESIYLLVILLVGGSGNKAGPLLGVITISLLPELLRFIGLPDAMAANLRQIIFGIILILLMYLRPKGLMGDYQLK